MLIDKIVIKIAFVIRTFVYVLIIIISYCGSLMILVDARSTFLVIWEFYKILELLELLYYKNYGKI